MILALGNLGDEVLAYLVLRLLDAGEPVMLVDPASERHRTDLAWRLDAGEPDGWLRCAGQAVELKHLRSVYIRTGAAQPDAGRDRWPVAAFSGLLETLPGLVVSRPSATATNASKPYQSRIIAGHGLSVPRTLITTDPDQARSFYERCAGRVIYKSVSYQRSIVQRLGPDELEHLERVRACPTQFQEYVPGIDVRVHVVGGELFATEVLTTATDYRYAARDRGVRMRDVELPEEVQRSCRTLAAALNLPVAGVDLRRTPDGQWFCFEVNASPAFTYYQAFTGQAIGDAVVALLRGG